MPRICLACGFFLPSGGEDEESPHRCDFGDFDFGDEDLRIDCSVFEEAASEEGGANRSGHEAREGNHREERGS